VIGPLCLEEFCWYRISDLFQPSSTTDGSLTSWGTPLGSPTDTGWAAASGPDGPYLEPVTYDKGIQIVGDSYSGDSSTVIDSFKIGPDVEIDGWWALATDDWAPCNFRVVVGGISMTLADASVAGAFEQGSVADLPPGKLLPLPEWEYEIAIAAEVPGKPDARCALAVVLRRYEPGIY